MKKKSNTPAKRGNGRQTPRARSAGRKASTPKSAAAATTQPSDPRLAKAIQQSANQPRYGTGLHYGTANLRYVTADPTNPPVNDGGKVVLNLSGKPDTAAVNFTYTHIEKMTDNDNYLDPQPSAVDFKALADAFASSVTALTEAKRNLTQKAADRDEAWNNLMNAGYGIRLPYIQIASNGNTAVILSSGLPVRATPGPTPTLQPPINLRIDLNTNPGQFIVSWDAVTGSKSFILQRSVVTGTSPDRNWETVSTSPNRKVTLNDQSIGTNYAFRVATIGGATGQSVWTLEVIRTAA